MKDSFDKIVLEEDPYYLCWWGLRKMPGLTRNKGLQLCFEFDNFFKQLYFKVRSRRSRVDVYEETKKVVCGVGKSLMDA